MKKHAYLIIEHKDNFVLETLIELLDDSRNDIFIHIDKKTKNFNFEKYKNKVKFSKIYFIPRIKVYWGGFSQIMAEINLLKFSFNKGRNYRYYHLLSGVDLPLKNQNEIHDFFKQYDGREFIGISKEKKEFKERMELYYFERLKTRTNKNKLLSKIYKKFEKLQNYCKIKRNCNLKYKVYKGCNWFSITNKLVEYILNNEEEIKKIYHHTYCCDEVFLQTLVMNSKFKENIYKTYGNDNEAALRYIDWEKGDPYIFKREDYICLITSNLIFARKFSEEIDIEIIIKIRKRILQGEENVRGI